MKYNKISNLPHSEHVDIKEENNNVKIIINHPIQNMQTDMANFEALAIMCKCLNPNIKVTIQFDNYDEWNKQFGNLTSESSIYLRFLFRLITFKEAFPEWVEISDINKDEVTYFENLLNNGLKEEKVSNNIPNKKAEFNQKKGIEHEIENKLTRTVDGNNYLKFLYNELYPNNELLFVYNQLPNGLFNSKINEPSHEENRIFTTGFYDIWGIDNKDNFCVFELKKDKGNSHLGVISELFFYAVYAHKILCNKKFIHEKKKRKNFRGYEKLYDFVQEHEIKGINAIFLLGKDVYPAIDERRKELKEVLDTNTFGINFDFMTYNIDIIDKISPNEIV